MAKKTPGAILATYDDLISKRAFELIQKNLGLRNPLEYTYRPDSISSGDFPYSLLEQAQGRYDRHLAYLFNLNLSRIE